MADDRLPLLTFADAASLERWLDEQGATSPGAWLRFAKKGAAEPTIDKSDAIDCALAYGWVDGQLGRVDEHYFKTRFTPRRSKSIWSQVNRERVERLEAAGLMRPAGRAQVERAKADGRWAAAYARQSEIAPDANFVTTLDAEPVARALFDDLDAANRFAILFRIQQAATPAKRGRQDSCDGCHAEPGRDDPPAQVEAKGCNQKPGTFVLEVHGDAGITSAAMAERRLKRATRDRQTRIGQRLIGGRGRRVQRSRVKRRIEGGTAPACDAGS